MERYTPGNVGSTKRELIAAYEHLDLRTTLSQFPGSKKPNFHMYWMGYSGKRTPLFTSKAKENHITTAKEDVASVRPALTPESGIRSHCSALP